MSDFTRAGYKNLHLTLARVSLKTATPGFHGSGSIRLDFHKLQFVQLAIRAQTRKKIFVGA